MEPSINNDESPEEIFAMPNCEEMVNNIKHINGILKELDEKPVYPVTNSSIMVMAGEGRPVEVIRLTMPQALVIGRHAESIELNDFSWEMSIHDTQGSLLFSRMFVTLEDMFGPSEDKAIDDGYKNSFFFPFLLKFPQEKHNLGYLMIVRDIKGAIHYNFGKIFPLNASIDRGKMPAIYEDFNKDAVKQTVRSFFDYVEIYFKSITSHHFDHFFYRTIRCNLGVYGYKDGEFFDKGYNDYDEYNEVIRGLEEKYHRKNGA